LCYDKENILKRINLEKAMRVEDYTPSHRDLISLCSYRGNGTIQDLKTLVTDKHISIDSMGAGHHSALMYASLNREVEFIREMVKLGANLNVVDDEGHSAFYYATMSDIDAVDKVHFFLSINVDNRDEINWKHLPQTNRPGLEELFEPPVVKIKI
jgi:ankyrin repeat protein